MEQVIAYVEIGAIVATAIVTIASIITASTHTPTEGSKLWKWYHIIEVIALNTERAKERG